MLLTGSELRNRLETELCNSSRCAIFSGFFTLPAAQWIVNHRAARKSCRIVTRGLVDDFISGASSLDAFETALNAGYQIGISTALHAKIYAFDEVLFSGSANLTAKGLALTSNANQELSVEVPLSHQDDLILNNIWSQSVKIDESKLQKMRDYINNASADLPTRITKIAAWPEDIFTENRDIYCSDFPQSFPALDETWNSSATIMQTFAYKWLETFIRANGATNFGKLAAQLHNDLYDDPKPYRTDVKSLLSNLLQVIETDGGTLLSVSRPRYSQVVHLKQ